MQLLHDLTKMEAHNDQDEVFSLLNENHALFLCDSNGNGRINDILHNKFARVIQRNLKKYHNKVVFKRIKGLLYRYAQENPAIVMRRINISEANLFDRISSHFLAFRLAGESFPPVIVYKIFTKPHTINLCYNVKRDFGVPVKRRRKDSNKQLLNDWKPICSYKHNAAITIRKHRCFQQKQGRSKQKLTWINNKYGEL